jgi:predicted nucleotidyltransferase
MVEITEITNAITALFKIEKIILFGSYAYGTPDKESDLDICIITNVTDRKIDVLRKIRFQIKNIINTPLDLLVYNKSDFTERAMLKGSLEYKINTEGKVLYG